MRITSNLGRGTIGFNMTPMIDIVFQLIIFFLVSNHLAQREVQVEVNLPDASSGERPAEENVRRVVVNVLADRQIVVGTEAIDQARLESLLRYESERTQRTANPRPLEVLIRTDRLVPYQNVEPILLSCARGGIWNVKFAVTEK